MDILVGSFARGDESMKRSTRVVIMLILVLLLFQSSAVAQSQMRIKDIARVVGVTTNQLMGFGVVVGLSGTGDRSAEIRDRSVANMLTHFGLTADSHDVRSRNTAAVIVTASLPPFVQPGDSIDITISSLFDAGSLEGGVLIMTPLIAPDGNTYAVAQGAVSIGGRNTAMARGDIRNHATVGTIPDGAIVQREVPMNFHRPDESLLYSLNRHDFTTAARFAGAVNELFGPGTAVARDGGTIRVSIPAEFSGDVVGFIASVENLTVEVDVIARVVINERTGTVVVGGNVVVHPTVVAHGNLSVAVFANEDGGFPLAEEHRLLNLPGASVDELVTALNAAGASPRDLIAIFQALKAHGALQAELEII